MSSLVALGLTIAIVLTKCILILIVASLAVKILRILVDKFFLTRVKFEEKKVRTLKTVTNATIKVLVYFTAITTILTIFGLDISSVIAVAGIGSIAIGFAAQNLVKDFITGGFIIIEDQYNIGDLIEINGLKGVVENLTMRITNLRSVDGSLHYVPNGEITTVTNFSKGFANAMVTVGVDYAEDVDRVLDVLKDEMNGLAEKLEDLIDDPEVLGVSELGESSVDILVVGKSKIGTQYQIERELRKIIKKRLDTENISIPFPQRVIHMSK